MLGQYTEQRLYIVPRRGYGCSLSACTDFLRENRNSLNVSEETVRRNIRSKRLRALRRGTQWFIPHDVLVIFANGYDPKTGQIRQML